ncbi:MULTISPECIES: cation diffusion facilitator family transporter [Thermodesulfovibrio]|uniref:Cation efflux system protein n=2 Tax=Thermodesulfovibrio yellowstonii TaxID=28262 RepID=B5YK75_THEYD|nr:MULTISPECIES: cation diffusion facilitator family transporter [Thermodesulfovibrio]ACI21508.1 cation efflux system protein [Thermodesulfovibrio yellowstonii DSM 11347]MDI6865319.1 cation diffusion facilitator family transporter [Thermodesulfovibrio yellowstonii]GLI53811.1 cation efflux system protein [Thermodesulfovibrio islandicus]
MDRRKEIRKVLLITLCLNLLVSFAKIIYGLKVNSLAIYSDGFHSLFDGVSNIGGIIGIYLASRPPDREHPYGHRKYETIFAVFIGVLMGFTSLEILKGAYESLIKTKRPELDEKAFIILLFTIIINIFVFTYERKRGKQLKSEFLIADSSHTKIDIFITSGIILAIIFIKSGFYILDSFAGLIIGVLVAREAFIILKESTDILIDKALLDSSEIERLVTTCNDVQACEDIRTRGTAGQIFVDLKILVDSSISVKEGHDIAERVEAIIKKEFPDVVDVVVHIEPGKKI